MSNFAERDAALALKMVEAQQKMRSRIWFCCDKLLMMAPKLGALLLWASRARSMRWPMLAGRLALTRQANNGSG